MLARTCPEEERDGGGNHGIVVDVLGGTIG